MPVFSMATSGLSGATTINVATFGEDCLTAQVIAKALKTCGDRCALESLPLSLK